MVTGSTKREISVTAEDICRGKRRSPCGCPVALAIKRVIGMDRVYVSRLTVDILAKTVALPKEVTAFIIGFDMDRSGQPFTFELEY